MRFTSIATITVLSATLINAYDPIKMLCLVNKERSRNGLPALGLSQQLGNAAQEHSDDQASMRSMTHDGSDGSSPGDRVERAGYDWRSVAENVAYGYGDEEECMTEWMNSPGHRENILGNSYTHFGSAMAMSGSTPYYTQDFAGDGKSHNFPQCPSGGNAYDDSGNGDSNDYSTPSPSKSGKKNQSNKYGDDNGNDYSAPSSNKYGKKNQSNKYGGGNVNDYSAPSSNKYGGSNNNNYSTPSSNKYGKKNNNYSAPSSNKYGKKNSGASKPSKYGKHKRSNQSKDDEDCDDDSSYGKRSKGKGRKNNTHNSHKKGGKRNSRSHY